MWSRNTSLTISDVRQTSHCVGVEQVGGLSCEVGDGSDVLVVASDGGDVVAGGGVVVGGDGVMMVSCGHAELHVSVEPHFFFFFFFFFFCKPLIQQLYKD